MDDLSTIVALQEREERWTDELLIGASQRVTRGWTQRAMAVSLAGEMQMTPNADSIQFCLLGALEAAAVESSADRYTVARTLRLVSEVLGSSRANPGLIAQWNDSSERQKADVLRVIETVLARRALVATCSAPASPDSLVLA